MLHVSLPLGWLTPSGYERLRRCPLQAAFSRARPHEGRRSPSAIVGDIGHRALDLFVTHVRDGEARSPADTYWERAADEILPAASWMELPRSGIVRAKLARVMGRLTEFLNELPAGSALISECELEGASGRLKGRADLIVRGTVGAVIDYKTGATVERDGSTKGQYERQLRLYAFMEHETAGTWPSRLILAPFTGTLLEVPVERQLARALAEDALRLLDEYESRVPGPQPARPSPDACTWCAFAPECDPFWNSYGAHWGPGFVAVRGVVLWAQAHGGRVSFSLRTDGSDDPIVVKGVRLDEYPVLAELRVDQKVAAVGIWLTDCATVFRAGPNTRFATG